MVVDPTLQSKVQELTDQVGLEVMLLALSLTTQVTESARMLPDDDDAVTDVSTPLVALLGS